MKIALVGYGKMGHMIEQAAKRAGHEVVATIDVIADDASVKVAAGDGDAVARAVKSSGAEGIIEFSHPTAVMGNIKALLPLGLPLVVGTTGWNDKKDEVAALAKDLCLETHVGVQVEEMLLKLYVVRLRIPPVVEGLHLIVVSVVAEKIVVCREERT